MNDIDEPQICVAGGEPLDWQIHDQLRTCILTGQLHPGEQLPTLRGLSVALAINPDTVERAYEKLEQEGLVSTADGSGVRVRATPLVECGPEERQRALEQLYEEFLARAVQLGFQPEEVFSVQSSVFSELRTDN
jgi:GntR family transcriptional regulator